MIEKDKTAVFIGNRDCYKIDKAIIELAVNHVSKRPFARSFKATVTEK